jgi:S-adenosylmethionine decarboxylase
MDHLPIGRHLIVDLWGEKGSYPFWHMDSAAIALRAVVEKVGATVLSERWHHFGEAGGIVPKFGYTGMLLLAESHLSVHTWPEHGLATVDVFMCGDHNPIDTLDGVIATYKARKVFYKTLYRGDVSSLSASSFREDSSD